MKTIMLAIGATILMHSAAMAQTNPKTPVTKKADYADTPGTKVIRKKKATTTTTRPASREDSATHRKSNTH